MSDNIVHTNDSNFDADVVNSDKPALVDFWAEWCGPCKMIAPFIDEAADEYADKLSVVKLNVDESPNVAAKFGIRSIPTLMLFKDGAVQAQKVGAFSKSQLTEFLDSNLCEGTWVIKRKAGRQSPATRTRATRTAAAGGGRSTPNFRMTTAISR